MTLDPTGGGPVTSALILAAGAGERLGGSVAPKPLHRVGGLPLIERTVVAAHRAGLTDIVVVTGHRAGELEAFLEELADRRGLAIGHIRAEGWEAGNAASLLAAEEELRGPFVLLMADHVFDHAILTDLVTGPTVDADVVLACDDNVADNPWVVDEEAVKVRVEDGRIRAIGKGLAPYDAYDTGIFLCDPAVFAAAHEAMERSDASLAGVIGRLAAAGRAAVMPVGSRVWVDVDTTHDLATAERFLYSGLAKPQDGWVSRHLNRLLSRHVSTPLLLRVAPGITPDQVSVAHLVLAIVAGLGFVAGLPLIAGALVQLSSILDGSDGEIARLKLSASRFGGFFDSVLDRYADGFIVSGMAVFAWQSMATSAIVADVAWLVPVVAVTALIGSFMVSYTTAQARADWDHRFHGPLVATATRDVRLLILAIAGVLALVDPISVFLGLCIVAVLTNVVVLRRLIVAWSLFERRPAAIREATPPVAAATGLHSADEGAGRSLIGPAESGPAHVTVATPLVDESPPAGPSPSSYDEH